MDDLCRHCRERPPHKKYRGLCWKCFGNSEIKALYPGRPTDGGDFCGGYQLPKCPTNTYPGTVEHEAALRARVEARVSLHHPQDRTLDGFVKAKGAGWVHGGTPEPDPVIEDDDE